VCGGDALDLFEAAELELLICGNPVLDFAELEKGAVYDDGYESTSRVILDLWAVLHQFNELDKKKFLKFLTGSDRSPIDGLSKLRFVITKNGTEDTRLPSAHTCFNHMLLPEYSSREVLEKNLRYAISESEGFALR
jgi:ubiquitin-protein ligase E3 A